MKNSKIYIIITVFAVLALLLVVFFIWPLMSEIEKNSNDLIPAKNKVAILALQSSETENFKKSYPTLKPNFDKVDQLFVDPSDPVDFIKFLEDTAASSRITSQISLPSSSQGPQPSTQNSIIFQLSSKGTFSDVLNFAKIIETGPYLIEIENLAIQNSVVSNSSTPVPAQNSKESSAPKTSPVQTFQAVFSIKAFTKLR